LTGKRDRIIFVTDMSKLFLLTRRDFLKQSLAAAGGLSLLRHKAFLSSLSQVSSSDKLGRICVGGEGAWFDLKEKPDLYSKSVGSVVRDDVIPWIREVAASNLDFNSVNQRWVETNGGYVYAGYVQPVKNNINTPLAQLPTYGTKPGMWVEITVPVSDLIKDGPPGSYWLQHTMKPRVYYGQVFWADGMKQDADGKVYYHLTQLYGSNVEYYWTAAESCRPITPEEIAPISPEVTDKKVVIDLKKQTLSCLENGKEVYFCRVSTGPKMADGDWATGPGDHPIWRKLVSIHMSASSREGAGEAFDTPGIAWTTFFIQTGAAIHTAYWHNEFGFARSHGCVNCLPEDAKFIWRWTTPEVQYEPGDLTWSDWTAGSSHVVVNAPV
jgi:hypothetical protein